MWVGMYRGRKLYQVDGTDSYYYRVPVGGQSFAPAHDEHAKVTLGRYQSKLDAMSELADRVDGEERR